MTPTQKITLERIDLQKKINQFPEIRSDEPDKMAERKALMDDLYKLDDKLKVAIEAEAKDSDKAFEGDSSENRERRDITGKADLGVLVGRLVSQHAATGAEAEAQIAWGLPGDAIPMAMVVEHRVAAAPADGGGASPFVGYQFPSSIADFCNIQRPRVAPGTPVFPSITAATVANRPAEAAESADSDPTLRGELLTPKRVQASTKISVEDRARFGGMAEAIAAHLAGAVATGLDQQALVGDEGFFDSSSGPLTEPNAPGAASTYANYTAMFDGGIDGRYASSPGRGSRVPGSGVRGRGSGERETTASSLAGKQQAREKEDNGGQGKDGPAGAIAQGGNGR